MDCANGIDTLTFQYHMFKSQISEVSFGTLDIISGWEDSGAPCVKWTRSGVQNSRFNWNTASV